MVIENLFDRASSIMTVVSFITFIGIVWWSFSSKRRAAFDAAALLPFADDDSGTNAVINAREPHHV